MKKPMGVTPAPASQTLFCGDNATLAHLVFCKKIANVMAIQVGDHYPLVPYAKAMLPTFLGR